MLARILRLAQGLELAAAIGIGAWLGERHGWSRSGVALAIVGWIVGVRLAVVCASSFLGWVYRSPRAADERIGLGAAVGMVLAEWRSLLAFNLFYLPWDRLALRADPLPRPTQHPPLLLVHGYFANRGCFRPLVRRLEALGVGPIFAPTFTTAFASIERFEVELTAAIERIAAGTGQSRLVVVAHSMGGLAARLHIARHGGSRIARLVTIASPHHGTALAAWGVGENAHQMRLGSAFLARLAQDEAAGGTHPPTACILSPHDNLVAPQASGRLPWAEAIALPGFGHISILASRALLPVLLPQLDAAGVHRRR
jgi:triacylglycerol lipase